MSLPSTLPRPRAAVGVAAIVALLAALLALVPTAAHADPPPTEPVAVQSGTITWGLHTSFRTYITGSGGGSVSATAPATDPGTSAGATTFPNASGTFATGSAATFATEGSVNYNAHGGVLNLTISNPRLVITDTGAEIVVDAVDSDTTSHTDLALASVDLDGHVSMSGGVVTIENAPAVLLATGEVLFANGGTPMYAAGTPMAPLNATIATTPITGSVTVSKTEFFADETATITVTGEGFNPSLAEGTRPPFNGVPSGVYIAFGRYADVWQPSTGAASSTRSNPTGSNGNGVAVMWAVPAASFAASSPPQVPGSGPYTTLEEDGTFETQITVNKSWLADKAGNFGIYTYAGGGANVASYETYTPISFVEPAVTVSKTNFFADGSETVTVTGEGFNPAAVNAAAGPTAGKPAGVFITFSAFSENWKPSDDAPSANRPRNAAASVRWALTADDIATVGGAAAGAIELNPDGTFSADIVVDKAGVDALNTSAAEKPLHYGIYTYAGGVATKYAPYETYTPVTFTRREPGPISATGLTATYGIGGTVSVTAPAAGTVTVAGLGSGTTAAAGDVVKFTIAKTRKVGTTDHAVSFVPADANLDAPTPTTLRVKITKATAAKPTLTIVKKARVKKKGEVRLVVAGVKGAAAPGGTVTIKLTKGKRSKTVSGRLQPGANGQVRLTLPKLARGKWKTQIRYAGDANYAARGFVKTGPVRVTM